MSDPGPSASGPQLTEADVAERLRGLKTIVAQQQTASLGGYHQAAAVLAYYDPDALRPFPEAREEDSLSEVLANSTVVYDPESRPHSMLRAVVRREALRRLGSKEAIRAALGANPSRPDIASQRMLEAYVEGTAPPLEQQGLSELAGTLQAADWLGDLVPMPDPMEVHRRLEREILLEPFRDLVGSHFHGRKDELERLIGYVGFLEIQNLSDALARGARWAFRQPKKKPLVINGPGGIGKSTLLAKFILDHLEPNSGPPQELPFVYLDFDRASLQAEEPISLLAEAVRQLGTQFPDCAAAALRLRDAWLAGLTGADNLGRPTSLPRALDEFAAFFDFKDFRELVAALADPRDTSIWVMNVGARRRGDTYDQLRELLRRLGQHYTVAWFYAAGNREILTDIAAFARAVAERAGWDATGLPEQSGEMSEPRYVRHLCDWLVGQAVSHGTSLVLVLEDVGSEALPPQLHDLLVDLIARLGPTPVDLEVILLNYPAERLGPELQERIAHLTPPDGEPGGSDFSDRPLLFVLDTFEEVQYRSREFAAEVLRLLRSIQDRVPRLRAVIVSRIPISSAELKSDSLALGPFNEQDAATFLTVRGLDATLARTIAQQVGGSPLSLRLALDVIQREGATEKGIASLQTHDLFVFRAQDHRIQGQLYRRILGHIHDADVSALVRLGLALRRITPEIIRDVLAEPCGVAVPDDERARQLFEELGREASLVTTAADGSLRFRRDVRSSVLGLLRQDEPSRVREVEERAVEFYQHQSGAVARAELVYHLLSLGGDRAEVDEAWRRGVERYLADALDELPPRGRAYLAPKLGLTVDEETLKTADLEDWEILAAQQGREILGLGRPEDALKLLSERPERSPGSPLHLVEAQALVQLERRDEARRAIAAGLAEVARAQDRMALLKLSILEARLDALDGRGPTAGEVLNQFARLSERFGDDPLLLRLGLHRLALLRSQDYTAYAYNIPDPSAPPHPSELEKWRQPVDSWEATDLARRLAALFLALPEIRLRRYSGLCRELAGAIGANHPEVLVRTLELVGFDDLRSLYYGRGAAGAALLEALVDWGRDAPEGSIVGPLADFLASPIEPPIAATLLERWSDITARAGPGWLERGFLHLAQTLPPPPAVAETLAAVYRDAAGQRTERELYEEMEAEQRTDPVETAAE